MSEQGSRGEGLGIKNQPGFDGHNYSMMYNKGLDLPIIGFSYSHFDFFLSRGYILE
jgi:hypothetical protein